MPEILRRLRLLYLVYQEVFAAYLCDLGKSDIFGVFSVHNQREMLNTLTLNIWVCPFSHLSYGKIRFRTVGITIKSEPNDTPGPLYIRYYVYAALMLNT